VPRLVEALFWWDAMASPDFRVEGEQYVLENAGQAIRIDRRTLLPIRQTIRSARGAVEIRYDAPRRFGQGFLFPSRITLRASSSILEITIRKLSVDVPLEDGLFRPAP